MKSELVQHESADGGVRGIFRQRDVVLRVQVANVQRGVKNDRTIGQGQWPLDHVEFVVNLADHLFDDVFQSDQPEDTAEFIDNHGHANVARAKLLEQLARWFRFRHDQTLRAKRAAGRTEEQAGSLLSAVRDPEESTARP